MNNLLLTLSCKSTNWPSCFNMTDRQSTTGPHRSDSPSHSINTKTVCVNKSIIISGRPFVKFCLFNLIKKERSQSCIFHGLKVRLTDRDVLPPGAAILLPACRAVTTMIHNLDQIAFITLFSTSERSD